MHSQYIQSVFTRMNSWKEEFNPIMYYAQYDKKIKNELSSLNRNFEFPNGKFPISIYIVSSSKTPKIKIPDHCVVL